MFLDLIDKLSVQMFTNDVVMLANGFDKLMASNDFDEIMLFNVNIREKLIYSPFPFIFKIYLLPFMTWFDHSILNELVKYSKNKEAIELVDEFNSYINYDEPILSCIPEISHLMIPYKGNESDYRLLVTKHFGKGHDKLVLRDLLNIKKELTLQWGITHHALQLVAMHSKLNYFYWMISKQIQPLIEKSINQGHGALWNTGIIVTLFSANYFCNKDIQSTNEYEFNLSYFSTQEVGNFFVNYII